MALPIHKSHSYADYNFTMLNKYRNEIGQFIIADYSSMQLPDSCYLDETHFNYNGARAFSKYLHEHGLRTLDAPDH